MSGFGAEAALRRLLREVNSPLQNQAEPQPPNAGVAVRINSSHAPPAILAGAEIAPVSKTRIFFELFVFSKLLEFGAASLLPLIFLLVNPQNAVFHRDFHRQFLDKPLVFNKSRL